MAKVIIKENGIEVYNGTLGGGSAFLGKHPLYLSHINQGLRKMSYKVPYDVYIDDVKVIPSEKRNSVDFNSIIKVGISFAVDGVMFTVDEIISLPYDKYMVVVSNGKEKQGFTIDRLITVNTLYTRIKRNFR